MIFANRPLFLSPSYWLAGELVPSSRDRYLLVQMPNGEYLSVNPASTGYLYTYTTNDGPYEQCLVSGDKLIFEPRDNEFAVIPFVNNNV